MFIEHLGRKGIIFKRLTATITKEHHLIFRHKSYGSKRGIERTYTYVHRFKFIKHSPGFFVHI